MKPFSDYRVLSEYGAIEENIPDYIINNLNQDLELREYQKEALTFFSYHLENKKEPYTQLLYHMATGSGKTLIMAANILYLYEKGYRNFIFFVNNSNILEKTKENFLNPKSSKYLFSKKIMIDNNEILINGVDNFDSSNNKDINIIFTTVQGLHIKLNNPQENSITYEDFKNEQIALISDEAHHINALTKTRLNQTDKKELNSWENTVNKILKSNSENIMLEFTATAELNHPAINEKYKNKIIYQYSLKEFRRDGFSKEVEVQQTDLELMDRAFQSLILSQYRRKIAEKYKIHLKPVILMKSKTIDDSTQFELNFRKLVNELTSDKFRETKNLSTGIIQNAFNYFENNDITFENLVREFKEDFDEDKCLSINTKNESEEKQLIVNSLESQDNEIRVIFAVDKLNEGWDVLNLFDIVRLYDTRDSHGRQPGKTTISEAQLIGRGARYFPFKINELDEKFKRKFDDDINNELRILEVLYYHSSYNPRYISELHQALVNTGIIPENVNEKNLIIKESFKESNFWNNGLIFLNERIKNNMESINGINDMGIDRIYHYKLYTGLTKESAIFDDETQSSIETVSKDYKLIDFGENIIRKALAILDFYNFNNISKYFPHLKSISEFINSSNYLKMIDINVIGIPEHVNNLKNEDKLDISINTLKTMSNDIKRGTVDYLGSKEFIGYPISEIVKDKTIKIAINEQSDQEYGIGMKETNNQELYMDLSNKDWYVYNENYGTSEEKYLTKYINGKIDELFVKFEEVYLIRNERLFKLYGFSDGAALEPDFILFLKNNGSSPLIYQLFIEAKGTHLIENDKWKEEFLLKIDDEHNLHLLHQNESFKLYGMPFFNEEVKKREFNDKLELILN